MWSKTRKAMYERLAPSLKDRVRYDFEFVRPHYYGEPPADPKCHCTFCSFHRFFAVVVDKKRTMIANNHFYFKNPGYPNSKEMEKRGIFEISDVTYAMHLYLNVYSIDECLSSEKPLLFLFAILDRRVGKRRIKAIYEGIDQVYFWLQPFIRLRAEAEGVL